jgi:MFS family permease
MRRLVALTSTIIAIDAMLFTALAPLIPRYATEFGLSKTGAGLLVGAFGAGALMGGVASGFAAIRFGPKPLVVVGLIVLAAASFAFAFAGGAWTLGASRFVQGLSSTCTWAGSLAHAIGIRVSFATVGVGALAMSAIAAASQAGPKESQQPGALRRALHDRRYVGALWLNALPALLFGLAGVLVPLDLSARGFSTIEIGLVFFGAGLIEVVLNPIIGRISDRRGQLGLVRAGLAGSATMCLLLAGVDSAAAITSVYVFASLAFGSFYTPSMALGSARAARAGLAQGLAFGTMNSAWAAGELVGPSLGGRVADLAGDPTAWIAVTILCLATLVVTEVMRTRPVGRTV